MVDINVPVIRTDTRRAPFTPHPPNTKAANVDRNPPASLLYAEFQRILLSALRCAGQLEAKQLETPVGAVGARVAAQATKETGVVAKDGTRITGLTRHAVDRLIGDNVKRVGIKPDAILDALKNPVEIKEGADSQGRPFKLYTGGGARVVINPKTGKIISTNPLSSPGARLS